MVEPQNQPFATRVRPFAEPGAMEKAARLILAGQPVAVPTETVYGLAADATQAAAVERIYQAKGRPSFNPLIVHVLDIAHARTLGVGLSDAALHIMRLYWPGPLTVVVKVNPFTHLAPAVMAGLDTVALRAPRHRAMRRLIELTGRPLAAPSANASGGISPTEAGHVLRSLEGRIPLVIDDGPTEHGLESTIVKIADGDVTTLRPGPVDGDELCALVRLKFGARWAEAPDAGGAGRIEAPGQLASHYAPSKPLRLEASAAAPGEWLIGFGAVAGNDSLSPAGDLAEAAANLFRTLHAAEAAPHPRIAVAPVPHEGLGTAINDRLRRAAAPR